MSARLVIVATLALGLGACASTPSPTGRVVTSGEANRASLGGVATAPLRDLNMVRVQIPSVLIQALDDPYRRPARPGCEAIIADVRELNIALGADLDEPPSRDDVDLIDKGRDLARDTAMGAVVGAAQDMIPLRSWVRRLTGAERHDRRVGASITAGGIRRGYLKGLGEANGCNPPATPSHILTKDAAAAPAQDRPWYQPAYPIR